MEVESTIEVIGGLEEGKISNYYLMGRVSVWDDETLGTDSGDECTILWRYLMHTKKQ